MTRDRGWAGIRYASEKPVTRLQGATKDSQGHGKAGDKQSGAFAVALRSHFLHDSVCVCLQGLVRPMSHHCPGEQGGVTDRRVLLRAVGRGTHAGDTSVPA